MWASDKLAACASWAQTEYAWLYGLADASGSFELTNLRVIWGRVAAIRKNLSLERLEQIFEEFQAKGLLFVWEENGKKYGHWTGSDVPGRLPPPSWRNRLERLAPPVPREPLAAYVSAFARGVAQTKNIQGDSDVEILHPPQRAQDDRRTTPSHLKDGLEPPQAQEEDREGNWNQEGEKEEKHAAALTNRSAEPPQGPESSLFPDFSIPEESAEKLAGLRPGAIQTVVSVAALLEIYEQERGPEASGLPPMRGLTPRCAARAAARLRQKQGAEADAFLHDFRQAVRRAAQTPFLCGENQNGWRASFDWFIAGDANVRKVLEGRYDAFSSSSGRGARGEASGRGARASLDQHTLVELHAGAGPPGPHRVKPEVLERERQRQAAWAAARTRK